MLLISSVLLLPVLEIVPLFVRVIAPIVLRHLPFRLFTTPPTLLVKVVDDDPANPKIPSVTTLIVNVPPLVNTEPFIRPTPVVVLFVLWSPIVPLLVQVPPSK